MDYSKKKIKKKKNVVVFFMGSGILKRSISWIDILLCVVGPLLIKCNIFL